MVGPTKFITQTNHGFWYTNGNEEEIESLPSHGVFNFPPSLVLCSQPNSSVSSKKKSSSTKKATLSQIRKISQQFKTLIKGKTSCRNTWTVLANSDLLEESYVKIQIPGFACTRLVSPPSSSTVFFNPPPSSLAQSLILCEVLLASQKRRAWKAKYWKQNQSPVKKLKQQRKRSFKQRQRNQRILILSVQTLLSAFPPLRERLCKSASINPLKSWFRSQQPMKLN